MQEGLLTTYGDDKVFSRLKRLPILLNIRETNPIFMPQNEVSSVHENLHHRIEVRICSTVAENQTTERLHRGFRVVEMDVTAY